MRNIIFIFFLFQNREIIEENYPISGHGILKYMNRFSQKNEQILFEERYQTLRDLRLSCDFFLNILKVNLIFYKRKLKRNSFYRQPMILISHISYIKLILSNYIIIRPLAQVLNPIPLTPLAQIQRRQNGLESLMNLILLLR